MNATLSQNVVVTTYNEVPPTNITERVQLKFQQGFHLGSVEHSFQRSLSLALDLSRNAMAPTATKKSPKVQTRPYEPSPEQLFCHRITGLRYHKNSVLNPQSLAHNVVSHAHASCMA